MEEHDAHPWVGIYTLHSVTEELGGERCGLVGEGGRKDQVAFLEGLLGLRAEPSRLIVLIPTFCAEAVVVHAVEIARRPREHLAHAALINTAGWSRCAQLS